jgi:protein TonB
MSRWRRVRVVVSFRGARLRLGGRFMTGSIAAHGLLLAAIVVIPMTHRTARPIEDAQVVALAGPIGAPASVPQAPVAKAAAPAAAPPAPPPPKEAHTVREVPVPKPKDLAKKDVKKDKPAEPTPAPTPAAAPAPAAAGAGAAAGSPGAGAQATGVTPTLGGGDASLGWYQAAVKAALESAWIKPYLEGQGATYSVTVSFEIARDGTVRDARIAESSGVPSLDRSALRAVLEASPLPGVPPTWKDDTLPATMRFDLTPEVR